MEPVADQPYSAATKAENVVHTAPNRKQDPLRFRRVQLALRALSLLYDLGCLSAFAYLYDRLAERKDRLAMALGAVVLGVVIDLYEVFRQIQKFCTRRRACAINALAAGADIAVFGVGTWGAVTMFWNLEQEAVDYNAPPQPVPAYVDAYGMVALMVLGLNSAHMLWSILSCIGGCVAVWVPEKRKEEVVMVYVLTEPCKGAAAPPSYTP